MPSIINATVTSGLTANSDTSGNLIFQTSSTNVLTLDSSQNATFAGSATFGGSVKLGNWTTAGRPSSPVTGQIGYNTSYDGLELYNGTAWTTLSGGPTFSAHLYSSTQSLPGGATTKITITTKLWDTANAFNNTGSTVTLNGLSVPSYSFCPPVAGYYQLSGMVQLATNATINVVDFFKNGTIDQNGNGFRGELATSQGPHNSSLMYLNGTGDYVDMRVYVNSTVAMMSQIAANYFQASFVRGV
jgi:hypothetical protein